MPDYIPDYSSYQKSISSSFKSLEDRFRALSHHWPTDGAWKETFLRSVLRRHLPESCIVGQGFIASGSEISTQIDILIISTDHSTLFKEDDLLIVTPDAVRAIIEVKTELIGDVKISEAIDTLTKNRKLCEGKKTNYVWTGLFSYNEANSETPKNLLKAIKESKSKNGVEVNCSCFGPDLFMRGGNSRYVTLNAGEAKWTTYNLEGLAPSFFIGNLIGHLEGFGKSSSAWFPVPKGNHGTYEIKENEDEPHAIPSP